MRHDFHHRVKTIEERLARLEEARPEEEVEAPPAECAPTAQEGGCLQAALKALRECIAKRRRL
jgi:hypothetical protein